MRRSHEPVFWALFGAGGMLAALFGPVLVFVTGIAVPLGLLLPKATMNYATMLALARNPWAALAMLAVISLFLFHGCHRLLHSLHDLGWRTGWRASVLAYGFAALATIAAATLLVAIRG
jgi:fumarate reductase subunit D